MMLVEPGNGSMREKQVMSDDVRFSSRVAVGAVSPGGAPARR